jgi:hypothetical protein
VSTRRRRPNPRLLGVALRGGQLAQTGGELVAADDPLLHEELGERAEDELRLEPLTSRGRRGAPAELTQLSTAMAVATRMDWGQDAGSSDVIRRGAFLVSEFAPSWDVERGSIDYYYWLFGTIALEPIGGATYDHWREQLLEALVPHQLADEKGGWWPAIDAWATEGTSVHATAVCTLALQNALK